MDWGDQPQAFFSADTEIHAGSISPGTADRRATITSPHSFVQICKFIAIQLIDITR